MQTDSRFEEVADSSVQADIRHVELEGVSPLEKVFMAHLRTPQKRRFSFSSALSLVVSLAGIPLSTLVAKVVQPEPSQGPETNPISYSAD